MITAELVQKIDLLNIGRDIIKPYLCRHIVQDEH